MKKNKKGGRGDGHGFTFTLSIVLLSLTLIAVASFAQEWRKSQQVSFTEILPSESLRLQERVAADFGQIVQADASLKSDNATTTLSVTTSQPFKREGQPIAKISDYSSSLPSNLRNLGYEAVLDANNMSGSNAAVILTSDNGSLVHSNDGAYDVTTFYQPSGLAPSAIIATISCSKQASSVGDLTQEGGSGAGEGQYYLVNYTEPSGRSYVRNLYASPYGNTSMSITYPDSTLLYFDSQFSQGGPNRTSVHYTKSSSGALILPFDSNTTGVVRDYSLFSQNVTLSPGEKTPTWSPDCSRGGCYQFDGMADYMFIPGGVGLTGGEVPLPLGPEMVNDPWFEIFTEAPSPDDGVSDTWYYWHIDSGGSGAVFDATRDHAQGNVLYSLHAINPDGSDDSNMYQSIQGVLPSAPYTLSFWAMGSEQGRYQLEAIPDPTRSMEVLCLDADGTWSSACKTYFQTAPSPEAYSQNVLEFMAPSGMSESSPFTAPMTLVIRLYPPAGSGDVYYDSVSLKQSSSANGGFESHYPEGGTIVPQD